MVYLVGAGAGDVGLLTLKACEILRAADVVIYDRLADDTILNFCADAKKIYVGKEAGHHTLKQSEINQLLVDEGKQNKIVVRLKGGDPFVFGRGGEEALYLHENGLPFEIIPGVSSAIAVPEYAGIPVTHRGIATSFAVITGHEDPTKSESTVRFDKLATAVDTLIFLMGVANLPQIVSELIKYGRKPDTSAALIRWGTKPEQEIIVTTLAEAPNVKILPPAIFVVGDVVNLREKLKWFDNRPLFGKKFVVTRARAQASTLSNALKNLGAAVVECPTIKIVDPTDNFKMIDSAIDSLNDFDWIIFTSANGVEKFFDRLHFHKRDARAIATAKVAAIGSATAKILNSYGIVPDLIPKDYIAESLGEELSSRVNGKKVLLARAEIARKVLPEMLSEAGADVTVAPVYNTIAAPPKDIDFDSVDMITFTSSSTVKNFVDNYGGDTLKKIPTAAIGSVTADTLKSFGAVPAVIAKSFTIAGLVEAIENFYGQK
ncbi:MAG: uroporphyrinogen-III C-methyltransferase [Selenomonadaceae bacterium]|nr:uroporphyrinogen-III C-methyltransferase [Selenomonadaceae bacterium]